MIIKIFPTFIKLTFIVFFTIGCGYQSGRRETFDQIVGAYTLDLSRTNLGEYLKDSTIYGKLVITFSKDSTFVTNFDVPFMYSSRGRWTAGNIHEWCRLLFNGLNYDGLPYPGTQFTRPYRSGSDTFLLMNATTPKDNHKTITELYFKKIRNNVR